MKKLLSISFSMLLATTLSACSIRPHVAKATLVEKVAKECINSDVHIVNSGHKIESSGAGSYVWYQFEDDRGINFRIGIDNRYVSFVEPIKPFYSNFYSYITDYKGKVIEHYEEDIVALLDNDNVRKYRIIGGLNGYIEIEFGPDVELSTIAETVMKINDMLDFDYYYNCVSDGAIATDPKARWHDFCPADIRVIVKNEDSGSSNYHIYSSFILSDGNSTNLTYDKLMLFLSADKYSKENSESLSNPIGMFMIDDVLYYDTGEVTDTVSVEDCSETTKLRVTGVPHNNGESNIGAAMSYTRVNDNELVVFYHNAGHIYQVFEY